MKHTKVAIIGAGAVGSTTAYALMLRNSAAEITLVDIDEKKCKSEEFDLSDALSFSRCAKISSACLEDVKDPDIIIIAAGVAQKPGQKRTDLAVTNKKIVTSIVEGLKPFKKHTIIVVVTNPVDAMAYFAYQASGLPHHQVFGTGTLLDSVRLRGFLSKKINISSESIDAYVLGEHGDAQFPAWSSAYIAGVPLLEYKGITKKDLDLYAEETRQKAYKIIEGKGATYFGIAVCVADMCENIMYNQKRIVPISRYVKEYDLFLSVPSVLGCRGVEQMILPSLNEIEEKQLEAARTSIEKIVKAI